MHIIHHSTCFFRIWESSSSHPQAKFPFDIVIALSAEQKIYSKELDTTQL